MTKIWTAIAVSLVAGVLMMPACASAKKGGSGGDTGSDFMLRAPSAQKGQVVFSIGPESFTDEDIKTMLKAALRPEQADQVFSNKEQLKNLLDRVVDEMVMEREASLQGMERDPETQMRLRLSHMGIMAGAFQKKFTVPDTDIQKYYEAHTDDYLNVSVKMMLTKTPDDAKKAVAEARKPGADFDEVAKKFDDRAKQSGKANEVSFMRAQQQRQPLPDMLDKAVYSLKEGEVSDPITVPQGNVTLVIKIVSRRQETPDEAKDSIKGILLPKMIEDAVKALRDKQGVKINDEVLDKMVIKTPESQAAPLPPPPAPGAMQPGSQPPPKSPPAPKKAPDKKPDKPNTPP